MKRWCFLFLFLALVLSACNGPAGESAPPASGAPEMPADRLLAVEGGYGGPLAGFIGSWRKIETDCVREIVVKYGVAAADGTVVCNPIYNWVRTGSGFLVMERTALEEGGSWKTQNRVTVAAPDGSWVLPSEYQRAWPMSDGRLLLATAAGGFWFCDRNGTLTASPLTDTFSQRAEETDWMETVIFRCSFHDGVGIFEGEWETEDKSGSWLLNALTGEIKYLPGVMACYGWSGGDPWVVAYTREHVYGYLDREGNWAIQPQFPWTSGFAGNCASVYLDEEGHALIDRSGQVVCSGEQIHRGTDRSGGVYYLVYALGEEKETAVAVYDGDGRLLPDHPLTGRNGSFYASAVTTWEDSAMTVWDYDGTILGTVEDRGRLTLHAYKNGRAVLFRKIDSDQSCGLYDLETGKWIVPPDKYSFVQTAADETVTIYAAQRKDTDGFDLLREDGTFLAGVDEFLDFTQGRIQAVDGENIIWLDLNGEEVFRWPNQSGSG